MNRERVKNVVSLMTLAEKVSLTSVGSNLGSAALPARKVPALRLPRELFFGSFSDLPPFSALAAASDDGLIAFFARLRCGRAVTSGESYGGTVPIDRAIDPFDFSAQEHFSDDEAEALRLAEIYCNCSELPPVGIMSSTDGDIKDLTPLLTKLGAICLPRGSMRENKNSVSELAAAYEGLIFTQSGETEDKVSEVGCGFCLDLLAPKAKSEALLSAVENGLLYERKLNLAVERTVASAAECYNRNKGLYLPPLSQKETEEKFYELGLKSAVLLRNENALPIESEDEMAFIGTPDYIRRNGKLRLDLAKVKSRLSGARYAVVYIEHIGDFEKAELKGFIDRLASKVEKVIVIVGQGYYCDLEFAQNAAAIVFAPFVVASALQSLITGKCDFSGKLPFDWGGYFARGYGLNYGDKGESPKDREKTSAAALPQTAAPSKDCERARKYLLMRAKKSGRIDERTARAGLSRLSPQAVMNIAAALEEERGR